MTLPSGPFILAFTRRLVHLSTGAAIDIALLRAARDVGAADAEIQALRQVIATEMRKRARPKRQRSAP